MTGAHHHRRGIPPQGAPAARQASAEALANPLRRTRALPVRMAIALLLPVLLSLPLSADTAPPTTRVGLPITLTDLYIPGGEAKPRPRPNHEPPVVIRLIAVKPAAEGKRYDLEVYGLEAGTYNLADFLVAADPATPPRFEQPIPLVVTSGLPPGLPRPAELAVHPPPRIGGYRLLAWILGIGWILGLLALLFLKRRTSATGAPAPAPPTLAERLHTLVTLASEGKLDADQQAALERLILGHWHRRLPELAALPPAEALGRLRHHDEAGPLLRQLEQWLHARNPGIAEGQIEELLAPYRTPITKPQ